MTVTVRPGFYLLDHPPASRQFYPSRRTALTGGVGVHTTESVLDRRGEDMGAENVAGFISRRSEPGSYHELVDRDSVVPMVPDHYTAFHVATPGYNSRTWGISIAARTVDLSKSDTVTRDLIGTVGQRIAAFWQRNGFDPHKAAKWVGGGAYTGPGLFCHGDVQPADRSDAWSRHPDRQTFDRWLIDAIHDHTAPAPEEEDDDMAQLVGWDPRRGQWYHVAGNLKVPVSDESVVLLRYLGVKDVGQLSPAWLDALGTVKA